MTNEQIFLSKNYTIIESPIPFTLRFNRRDSSAESAEDTIYMKMGWYIFDNNKLLPWEVDGVKNTPKYNAWIEYDESKLEEGQNVRVYTSWVNPKSIESLNKDEVSILGAVSLNSNQFNSLSADVGAVAEKIDSNLSPDSRTVAYSIPWQLEFLRDRIGKTWGNFDFSFKSVPFVNGAFRVFASSPSVLRVRVIDWKSVAFSIFFNLPVGFSSIYSLVSWEFNEKISIRSSSFVYFKFLGEEHFLAPFEKFDFNDTGGDHDSSFDMAVLGNVVFL